ncbi:hypothetical protein AKJ16_DCAP25697 [Drosera capensis]
MSLTLLQGYSSAEEDAAAVEVATFTSDTDREDADDRAPPTSYKPVVPSPKSSSSASGLPSALEAFSEVSGPPEFLNNCIEERDPVVVHRGRRRSRDKKDLPAGDDAFCPICWIGLDRMMMRDRSGDASNDMHIKNQENVVSRETEMHTSNVRSDVQVSMYPIWVRESKKEYWNVEEIENEDQYLGNGAVMEAKPQLVGIRERVRNDIDGNTPSTSSSQTQKGSSGSAPVGGQRVSSASNPGPEDASELLRMCLQCGIPKTYSEANGMVCPQCGDRPPMDDQGKKKGSMIKDKEKVKRMRGQSSHATWKSETEMQLRQQFD